MKFCFIFLIIFFPSTNTFCQDKKNISVTGRVTDELSGEPIPNAEVLVVCWYRCTFESDCTKNETIFTDEQGNFKAVFKKGHQVDAASKARGYVASRSRSNKLSDNHINLNLKLRPAKENPSLIKYLSTEHFDLELTEKSSFLHVRFYATDSSNHVDSNTVRSFGFDFHSLKTSSDTSNCDLWYKPVNKLEHPKVVVANKNGGIIPVFSEEIKSSFLYEKTSAPASGYLHEYQLKGNEEGFFVLCRDGKTYGKIIFEKSEGSMGGPDGKGGYFEAKGKNFSCLYQPDGTRDLSYSNPHLNLEDFLLDFRLL